MWQEKVLVWEETNHLWDSFGNETSAPSSVEDDLYARGLVIWKKTTLEDFVDKATTAFDSANEYMDDQGVVSGFLLFVSAVSLFPFHLKVIEDDEVAEKFLEILQREDGEQYLLKQDIANSEFAKMKTLNILIEYLVKEQILIDINDKYIINGKVLNGAHILKDD